mgnify:CR=1 FL=1
MSYKFDASSFWADRPATITKEKWLFHPLNKQRLPGCAGEVLRLVRELARPKTWFHQSWLAGKIGRSIRWAKEILKRLEQIGAILVDRGPDQNYYRAVALEGSRGKAPATSPHEEDLKKSHEDTKSMFPAWLVEAYQRWKGRTGKRTTIEVWAKGEDCAVGG